MGPCCASRTSSRRSSPTTRVVDEDLLRRAYVVSAHEHRNQLRSSGEPYLVHPLAVAMTLAEMKLDDASIAAGLLHDVLEDRSVSKERIAELFGADVAHLVDGVTKIGKYAFTSKEAQQAETFRKMLLAMTDDLRVILVKLADRLHNMQTLEHVPEAKQRATAAETLEIYAPLANRLGMGKMKGDLEDLSFRFLHPEEFAALRAAVDERMAASAANVEKIRLELVAKTKAMGIEAEITGRVKRYWSIRQKLIRQAIPLEQLYDVLAFRVLVDSIPDCYTVLGIVHQAWRPVPGRIKDYIAMPKRNFYQSLHTTLVPEGAPPFEVQIRTREMDLIAENGIAAHWKYKEGKLVRTDARHEEHVGVLRQILETTKDVSDPREFLSSLRIDLYPDDVYTFSPKGAVYAFPRGATPVDFAYRVHTDVGHHCVGARVNGRLVPLKTPLENGDIVEILTAPSSHPSRDWLVVRRDVAGAQQDPRLHSHGREGAVGRDRPAPSRARAQEVEEEPREAPRGEGLRPAARRLRRRRRSTTSSPTSGTGRSRRAPSSRGCCPRRPRLAGGRAEGPLRGSRRSRAWSGACCPSAPRPGFASRARTTCSRRSPGAASRCRATTSWAT